MDPLRPHICHTSDGAQILCLCTTGKDHDEFDFDRPDAPDYREDD